MYLGLNEQRARVCPVALPKKRREAPASTSGESFTEVKLKNGNTVALNWDESGVYQADEEIYHADYRGVYFDEEYANGRIDELKGAIVTAIQLYAEDGHQENDFFILEAMSFTDEDKFVEFDEVNDDYEIIWE